MSNLALLGGEKAVTLDYSKVAALPKVSEEAIAAACDVMRKGQISNSPIVDEFEEKFRKYTGAKYSVAMSSGTACLHAAIFGIGLKPGEEVIVPSFTYWASASPIVAAGGVPVFCDVELDTHCIDAKDVEKRITPKTRAIMVVHVWGAVADMDAIMAVAKKHNLKVIEDCSHGHGATYHGKNIGTIGDAGCYSLQGSKTLVAGEGGILITNDRNVYERAMALGLYERLGALPEDSEYRNYAMTGMGHKYRVHPVGIAIANTELDVLDEKNALRAKNARYLEAAIADLKCIIPQKLLDNCKRLYSYHYMRYDPEQNHGISLSTFLKALSAEGVICGICGYGELHLQKLFNHKDAYGVGVDKKAPEDLPVTDKLHATAFFLAPRFEKECTELIDQYAVAYHKVCAAYNELLEYENKSNDALKSVKAESGRSINLVK